MVNTNENTTENLRVNTFDKVNTMYSLILQEKDEHTQMKAQLLTKVNF